MYTKYSTYYTTCNLHVYAFIRMHTESIIQYIAIILHAIYMHTNLYIHKRILKSTYYIICNITYSR